MSMKQNNTRSLNNSKRKDPPPASNSRSGSEVAVAAIQVTPTTTNDDAARACPYETRQELLEEYRASADTGTGSSVGNCNYVLWYFCGNVLELIPDKLEALGVEEVEELSEDDLKKAYASLTMKQVDDYHHAFIVRKQLIRQLNTFIKEIYSADPRNDPDEGIMMLNTHSSWCMYPVIQKQLTKAQTQLNKAIKDVQQQQMQNASVPGIAQDALEMTLAAVFACDQIEHWRMDTESPEDCDKIARKVSKILKDLFWFQDEELGFTDPFTRKSILKRLKKLSEDWKYTEGMEAKVTYKSAKNGQGRGRPDTNKATPTPALKKLKTAASTTMTTGSHAVVLTDYLDAIQDKLKLRVKTHVQLHIANVQEPHKSCRVVCSGATCMKKLGQLVAYLTDESDDYHYHSQKGRSLKGSRFELEILGGTGTSKVWLAEKALHKQATAAGATHLVDKTVKIVQVVQGLITGAYSGMVYDSEDAKKVSLVWVANNDKDHRYQVTVQGILPNKCGEQWEPLPRLVDDDNDNRSKKTGFKQNIHRTNTIFRGDRQSPPMMTFGGMSRQELQQKHAKRAAKPICSENGIMDLGDAFSEGYHFQEQKVQSAGPP